MTSKIVVNNIEADSGINTVTFNSNISGNLIGNVTGNVNSTGVTTVTSLRIGTGTSISSPATNVLTLGTNNLERIRVGAGGSVNIGATDTSYKLQVTGRAVNSNSYGILHIRDEQTLSGAAGTGGIFLSSSPGTDYYIAKGYDGSDTKLIFGNGNNGTEYMKIDSSGRITTPSQVAFHAPKTVGDTLTTTAAKLSFSSATYDVGSNYSDANDRFTAPVAGKYFFYTSLNVLNSANNVIISIRKNGNIYGQIFYASTNFPRMDFNPVGIIDLAVNDFVEIYGVINTGTTTIDNAGYFGGYLLG